MKLSMMWRDEDPKKPLLQKITQAVAFFKDKYGIEPNVLHLPPSCDPELRSKLAERFIIHAAPTYFEHEFWVGIENDLADGGKPTSRTESTMGVHDFARP